LKAVPALPVRPLAAPIAEPRWAVHPEWDGDERFGCKIGL